jgi:predicted dehydrogenase
MQIGIFGCGVISGTYLENFRRFDYLKVGACADLDLSRAEARAAEYGVPTACSVDDLLADPSIDIVVNLTIPAAHAPINLAAVAAGKHVYSEKPLTRTRADGQQLLAAARTQGVRVSCAPETFLGAGLQTCRRLIDEGALGTLVGATAFMLSPGPENWHPDPDFFFQPGAGPLFDMGPYYLTALVNLLGPVRRVSGSARITRTERLIGSQPRAGTTITVNTPTHVAGVLDFANGAIGTLVTSFDVVATGLPPIEIYGTQGTLSVPDPNTFGGPVRLRKAGEKEWQTIELTHANTQNCRGIGVADMARAIETGRPHRASGDLAYHVLDVMQSILDTAVQGQSVAVDSTVERPAPLPEGMGDWELD